MSTLPHWHHYLHALALLAVGGFGFVVLSGFWHVLALLCIAGALLWLWHSKPSLRP